jgi:hypothetical protein
MTYKKIRARRHYGSIASVGYNSSNNNFNPFGPLMAEDTFRGNGYLGCDDEVVESEYDDVYAIVDEEPYQLELPLTPVAELEEQLRQKISHLDRHYRAIAKAAMQWHYLQDEIEENENLAKQWRDLQMTRKLSGSDKV